MFYVGFVIDLPVVKGVGPDGNPAERSGDRGIVGEELVRHHAELFVASDAQVGGAHAHHGTVGDVRESFDDQPDKH